MRGNQQSRAEPQRFSTTSGFLFPLHCNIVDSCFFGKQFARLVGAGLALPPFRTLDNLPGQGKPSPYETRWLRLRRARICRAPRLAFSCYSPLVMGHCSIDIRQALASRHGSSAFATHHSPPPLRPLRFPRSGCIPTWTISYRRTSWLRSDPNSHNGCATPQGGMDVNSPKQAHSNRCLL